MNLTVETWPLDKIIPYDKNAKLHHVEWIAQSISEFSIDQPIVVDGQGVIIKGHGRLKAAKQLGLTEFPVVVRTDLTPEQIRLARIADNRSAEGGWDSALLGEELNALLSSMPDYDFDALGLTADLFSSFDLGQNGKGSVENNKLNDRFIVPPFSILDTRQGYWQERKKAWKEKIQDNGESRENSLGESEKVDGKYQTGCENIAPNVSILDPVLAEIVNLWFGLPLCNTFDCFAGDSVFGFVSGFLGNTFTGIELRQEQAALNQARADAASLPAKYICDDGQNVLNHIPASSQDLLFSCPPYFDLEVYSDLPNDASNQKKYADFLKILDTAFTRSIECLKENRFAVIVIGDVRDNVGFYLRLPDDIKTIFQKNKMRLYNEIILIEQSGTAAIRAGKIMQNRKVVKTHQNVLVFFKGDIKQIKQTFPTIEYDSTNFSEGI